jgi:hypothetical protein
MNDGERAKGPEAQGMTLPEGTRLRLLGVLQGMVAVYYPYRKSADMYILVSKPPEEGRKPFIHCCQCAEDVVCDGREKQNTAILIGHIKTHDRRVKVQREGAALIEKNRKEIASKRVRPASRRREVTNGT